MRIQHNIMAMSAYRNYTNNVSAMKKNLEKLSSGYKINRAGDDAAGLAISEKMRAQITGLETAQKNAKDGISLVQTAEGALTEVHDMLNRMVELATMSANGTYDSTTDRAQLQKEMDQLRDEINRIRDSANFNGIKLLNGEMNGVGAVEYSDIDATQFEDGAFSGGEVNKGEYHYDLGDLKINLSASVALTSGDDIFALTVSGVTLGTLQLKAGVAREATDDAVTLTTGDFSFVAASSSVTLGGLDFDVGFANGQITLTGTGKAGADPTAADVTTFNGANLSLALDSGHAAVKDTNQGYDFEAHVDNAVAAAGDRKLAGADFALTDGDIKDGTILKIGNETYAFKVGSDGKGATANHEIDLTSMKEGDSGIARKAIELLSQSENKNFHIITNNDGASFGLREKDNVLENYDEWDLDGADDADNQDATWTWKTGDDKGKSLVQLGAAGKATGKSLTLQIGDTADSFNQLKVNIQDMNCASLGIKDIKISDQDSAATAIDAIKAAINTVSDVRGTLGATQNRLDHTINNLSVMTENIQDAESTIRDVDVAEEMMAYTKNNILIQSAQAMLAQANQVPQGVLQLLQ